MEPIPINGKHWVIACEFMKDLDGNYWIWARDEAKPCSRIINLDDGTIDLDQWLKHTKPQWETDLDSYMDELKKLDLDGKNLMLSFSGGKDSLASLYLLLKLMEFKSFKLHVCYVHFPFLESKENVKFIDRVERKLKVEIKRLEPPRDLVKRYLLRYGLPYRRNRWCTYLKVKPLKIYKKENKIEIEVTGDRMNENPKRERKYSKYESFLVGKQFRIIYKLSLIDVIKLCRRAGLIHPKYKKGFLRVACKYCPYKSYYECLIEDEVEDEGFINEILKWEHSRWYKDLDFGEFISYSLWRYVPTLASLFKKAHDHASELDDGISFKFINKKIKEFYRRIK